MERNMKEVFSMEKPLISIILPIYNVQDYLPKCMASLFEQTYTNLEIIMVDDGSEIECSKLCDEFKKMDKRVVVYHKQNGGLSDARNYGIERANGEYITCIDPDDYVDKDYIEYLYNVLDKYKSKMSICQHRVKYDNGSVRDYGSNGDEKLETSICLERMLYHDVIDTSAWAKLYHRTLFNNVKYPKGKLFEDIGTTYALMMQCDSIAVGYESKYNYIFHENSIVNSEFKENKLDLLEMTDKMGQHVVAKYPQLKDAVLRRRVYARLSTLNQMFKVEGYTGERNSIIKFIKDNRKKIMINYKTPKRDKVAIALLCTNYRIYKFCWSFYKKYLI